MENRKKFVCAGAAIALGLCAVLLLQSCDTRQTAQSTAAQNVASMMQSEPEPSKIPTILPDEAASAAPMAAESDVQETSDSPKASEKPTLATPQVEVEPTKVPAAPTPTAAPTVMPTEKPTSVPTVEPTIIPTAEPTAVPDISHAENGWQPSADEHYHGNGADSGVCPACGLIYGPSGGFEGQYGPEDGQMD